MFEKKIFEYTVAEFLSVLSSITVVLQLAITILGTLEGDIVF